ncbi:MAG: hypothetical protein WD768_05185 [Phycisphaeraceae bacterium]
MNTYRVAILCLVMVTFSLAGCGSGEWVQFSSIEGMFKATFPHQPDRQVNSKSKAVGFNAKSDDVQVGVTIVRLSGAPLNDDQALSILKKAQDLASRELGANVSNQSVYDWSEVKVLDYVLINTKSGLLVRHKTFIRNRTLYSVSLVGTEAGLASADAVRFMDSFQFRGALD